MDRPAQGHRRGVTIGALHLDAADLDDLQSWAKEFYVDGGTPDVARSWCLAIDRMIGKHGLTVVSATGPQNLNKGSDNGSK